MLNRIGAMTYSGQRVVQGAVDAPDLCRTLILGIEEGRRLGRMARNDYVGGVQLFSDFSARPIMGVDKQPYVVDVDYQPNVRAINRVMGYGNKF